MDKQTVYLQRWGVYVPAEKGKLCCQLNAESYCTGCKVVLCNTCASEHYGAAFKCAISLTGECWPIDEYITYESAMTENMETNEN